MSGIPTTVGLLPASFGLSSSSAGALKLGEIARMPDDNFATSPATAVIAYGMPTPRTHAWVMLRTAHNYLWGSSDSAGGAGNDFTLSDEAHQSIWGTCTGTLSTGHVGVGAGGGTTTINLFATSHQRISETMFMIPVLSTGSEGFNVRVGFANTLFGAVAHGCYIEIDSNANVNAQCVTSAASVRTTTDSGVTITAGVWYRLRVVVTNNTAVDFYIAPYGTPFTTPTRTNTTNIPTGTGQGMQPVALIEKNIGNTNRAIGWDYILAGMDRLA